MPRPRKQPPKGGGILALLDTNLAATIPEVTTPPTTLILSKNCECTLSDDDEDVSVLESTTSSSRAESDSSMDEESLESTSDEESDSEEENGEEDDASDDELEVDEDSSIDRSASASESPGVEEELNDESDFDPDDTLSDDEDLDADDSQSEEFKIVSTPDSSGRKNDNVAQNGHGLGAEASTSIQSLHTDVDEYFDADLVVAEIVEDESTEDGSEQSGSGPLNEKPVELSMDLLSCDTLVKNDNINSCDDERSLSTASTHLPDVSLEESDTLVVDRKPNKILSVFPSNGKRETKSSFQGDVEANIIAGQGQPSGPLTSSLVTMSMLSPIKVDWSPTTHSEQVKAEAKAGIRSEDQLGKESGGAATESVIEPRKHNPLFSPIDGKVNKRIVSFEIEGENTKSETKMVTPPRFKREERESPYIEKSVNRAIRALVSDRGTNSVRKGEWKLGKKLGSGAFGVVHVGMNTATGTLMAVKSIKMEGVTLEDVRREIELLRCLDHPNIVAYHGAEIDKSFLHIFQEWVPGGSVTGMLASFGSFPMAVARNYLSQILQGLSYLHGEKVLHRDLKGSNVLIKDNGIVKLADFGSSRRVVSQEADLMLSLTMRGTPYFMAPEVFEEKYSFKADIWSVGCVAFQMITGSPPWKEKKLTNPVSLFNHLKNTEGVPTSSKYDSVKADDIHSFLMCCFQRHSFDRPCPQELLNHPFIHDHNRHSDEVEVRPNSLFPRSPATTSNDSSFRPETRSGGRVNFARRNSLNSPCLTFGTSPSATVKTTIENSPQPDMSDWPSWARQRKTTIECSDQAESLVYSTSRTSDISTLQSPLLGMKLLSLK